MSRESLVQAAAARAAGFVERSWSVGSRPSQRRAAADVASAPVLTRCGLGSVAPVSARAVVSVRDAVEDSDTGPLVFEGMASVTGQPYTMWDAFGEYEELVHVGSFVESLSRSDLDVPLVIDHVSSRRIARTTLMTAPLSLTEVTTGDRTGLRVLAPMLDRQDSDVMYIVPKLRSGLLDEMSFRFVITSGRWSDDYTQFHIHGADIHRGDVSIVGYGASPLTAGSGLRSARAGQTLDGLSDDELRAELERRNGHVPDPRAAARANLLRILDR